MNCKQFQDRIIEALYGELTQEAEDEFGGHAASCAGCNAQYKTMRETVEMMNQKDQPGPDKLFLENQWKVLHNRIESYREEEEHSAVEKNRAWPPVRIPYWAYGIAAMVLIAVGIYLDRALWRDEAAKTQPGFAASLSAAPSAVDSVTSQALSYLGKSKNLLLGVMNSDDNEFSMITFQKQQKISRQLVQQAAYFKNSLNKPEQQQLKYLIRDLEIILMQLANIEVKPGTPAVDLVKRGVSQKSILFKINVEEIRSAIRESAEDNSENNEL